METLADRKLEALADSPIGRGRSLRDLTVLGRFADLVTIPAGGVLQHRDRWEPWSYYVLDGTALVTSDSVPIAVATSGAWFLGPRHRSGRSTPVTVVSATGVRVLTFRPDDLIQAVESLPGLVPQLTT